MNIQVLGAHSCESKSTSCVSLLIDKTIAFDAGGLTSNLTTSEQLQVKDIFLSHQHYDHIRDIPAIAFTFYQHHAQIRVHCTAEVRSRIIHHILNGVIYPELHKIPATKPTVIFQPVTPDAINRVNGCEIRALPVNHFGNTVGYHIRNGNGNSMFYTGDTGPGLSECWHGISPRFVVAEVTFPNRYLKLAIDTKHLTPYLLKEELNSFVDAKGYLPEIVVIHMSLPQEKEIKEEINGILSELDASITVAYEGMTFQV